jgi:tetratricopeptide (TPR) repeat protein
VDYAQVLLQLNRNSEALSYAERAVRANPQMADAFTTLGYAYYRNNRNADAIAALKKSLALNPSPTVQELIARVQRESTTEAEFREQESSHFVLRYEGSKAPDALRRELVGVLESQYTNLQNDLGASPRETISVSLYTNQEFFDVTHAPAWTSALNDGKLRIPISGLTSMTPALTRVLRHELTHSFTSQITHEHIPQWLDEGLAQLEEPLSTAPMGRQLAALYSSGQQIPLNQLESSFLSYNADQAAVAYAESLAAVECIREKYGMSDLSRILQRLGEGQPIESALRNTIHEGYAQLEGELGEYLKGRYAH